MNIDQGLVSPESGNIMLSSVASTSTYGRFLTYTAVPSESKQVQTANSDTGTEVAPTELRKRKFSQYNEVDHQELRQSNSTVDEATDPVCLSIDSAVSSSETNAVLLVSLAPQNTHGTNRQKILKPAPISSTVTHSFTRSPSLQPGTEKPLSAHTMVLSQTGAVDEQGMAILLSSALFIAQDESFIVIDGQVYNREQLQQMTWFQINDLGKTLPTKERNQLTSLFDKLTKMEDQEVPPEKTQKRSSEEEIRNLKEEVKKLREENTKLKKQNEIYKHVIQSLPKTTQVEIMKNWTVLQKTFNTKKESTTQPSPLTPIWPEPFSK